jgi:hypothetical protein
MMWRDEIPPASPPPFDKGGLAHGQNVIPAKAGIQ